MGFLGTDDFQKHFDSGYYFDRGIDLEFYDSDKNLLGKLVTPRMGMKPSITVKGTLIEGSYAVNSYISVQNLAYNININAVETIKCTVYYNGLRESYADESLKYGHAFLFSVLYADQEKEPPNRAVRFQCSLAAFDFAAREANVDVKDGVLSLPANNSEPPKARGAGNKNGTQKKIIAFLKELAGIYNDWLDKEDNKNPDKKSLKKGELIKIVKVRYPKILENESFSIPTKRTTFKGLLDELNAIKLGSKIIGFTSGTLKITITPGVFSVDIMPPQNWSEQLQKNGTNKNDVVSVLIDKTYKDVVEEDIEGTVKTNLSSTTPIKLNYVKSAYRNEIIITCSTLYDDRIRAGCYCVIAGNAIMGKHAARSSRMVKLPGQKVLFRATGAIEYEFSTTEDSTMTITGPVVDEDYKEK